MSRKITINWSIKSLKSLVILGALGLGANDVFAQQDPYFTHYMFNKLQFNPGAAGEKEDNICISGIYHTQWTGYEDQTSLYHDATKEIPVNSGLGPKTTGLSIDARLMPLSKKIDLGVGLAMAQDNLGYETNMKLRAALSGIYNMNDGSSLALGVELGMLQKGIDGSHFVYRDLNDPNIPLTKITRNKFNTAVGLYYKNPNINELYVGLSSTNVNESTFDYSTSGGDFSNSSRRHFYLMAGMTMENFIGNPSLEFMPSILVKNANTTQFTLSGLVEYSETFSGGLAYRTEFDAISLLLGYRVNPELRIGYSYDFSFNALRKYQGGSHEFQVNYCFNMPATPPVKPDIELSPRFLNKDPNIL